MRWQHGLEAFSDRCPLSLGTVRNRKAQLILKKTPTNHAWKHCTSLVKLSVMVMDIFLSRVVVDAALAGSHTTLKKYTSSAVEHFGFRVVATKSVLQQVIPTSSAKKNSIQLDWEQQSLSISTSSFWEQLGTVGDEIHQQAKFNQTSSSSWNVAMGRMKHCQVRLSSQSERKKQGREFIW